MFKHHYVYEIICQTSNRSYIGVHSTVNLEDGYFGSGKVLRKEIQELGKDNFKKRILYMAFNREEALEIESLLVSRNTIECFNLLNVAPGGGGGCGSRKPRRTKGIPLSEKHKAKLSIATKRQWSDPNSNIRNSNSEETKLKKSSAMKALWQDPQFRARMIESRLGMKFSEEHKKNISAGHWRNKNV